MGSESDEVVSQRCLRPSRMSGRTDKQERVRQLLRQEAEPRVGVKVLAYRYANGLDLWTGLPLKGRQAKQWRRCQLSMEEVQRGDEETE